MKEEALVTHIYFVRHAHSIYTPNERERPLSPKGMDDAQRVAILLESAHIDVILSSPYRRAIETVGGVAEFYCKEIEVMEGLRERKLSGVPVTDFATTIKKVWKDPSFSFEGGESNLVAQQRGIQFMEYILEKYEGENIVIGTHGNIMVLIMNYYDNKFDFTFWENLRMPDIYRLNFAGKALVDVERIWTGE